MSNEQYLEGEWIDSNGRKSRVRYKKTWGEHVFTTEENKKLLSGEEISFLYKGGTITGHLQYYIFKGGEVFGFKANFPDNEYDRNPVYHERANLSSFEADLEKEKSIMSEYMRLNYYSKLLNRDHSRVEDYRRISEEGLQREGVDVTYTIDGKRYIVDEKAQMDYIYNNEPLPTFSLELLNSASGTIGWLINANLKTEYYMFIWPHADGRPLNVNNIEYAYYALVNKKALLAEIEKRYKTDSNLLLEYAKKMAKGDIGEEAKYDSGRCVGYRYKGNGFDDNGYLFFTLSKPERPVNLIVRRSWLEELSESHGIIKRS